jgi:predicted nuclease of predicted toxin-antitoxin system
VKIKLDENIGSRGLDELRAAGHDVMTVAQQNLEGASDRRIYEVCVAEARTLMTLDRGFGEILRFAESGGSIVVLELSDPITLDAISARIADFVSLAATRANDGELWVVGASRVRVRSFKPEQR